MNITDKSKLRKLKAIPEKRPVLFVPVVNLQQLEERIHHHARCSGLGPPEGPMYSALLAGMVDVLNDHTLKMLIEMQFILKEYGIEFETS